MRPIPVAGSADAALEHLAAVPFSVLAGPVGTFVAERLAATIAGRDRWHECVWLRAGHLRPEALAQELVDACRHRWGGEAADAGGVAEAPRTLRHLLGGAPFDAVVVVEGDARTVRSLQRVVADLRPGLADRRTSVIAVAESPVSPWRRLVGGGAVGSRGVAAGAGSADTATGVLSPPVHDRLWALAERRPAVVHDLLAGAQVWGADTVSGVVGAACSLRTLLDQVTAELLDRCDAGELAALRTCAAAEYWHPQLTVPPVPAARLRPWAVPLEEGWWWVRPIWRPALRRQLVGRHCRGRAPRSCGRAPSPFHLEPAPPARSGILQARLFGELEVRVDGRVVRRHGRRGASVLRLLLTRPRYACGRDELLATFWPDVPPDVARNRLQVVVSGLRRAFGQVTAVNVVEYVEGGYRINPVLRLEVDVDRFESVLAAAKRADRAGDAAAALARYREAVDHYRGDFAADAPSEAWTLVPRESLRIAFVDALGRLGRLELARGACDDAVGVARRMLDVDPCREDAHRLLMCCFAQQGHPYQAHRQYDLCRRVLRSALDVEPAPETVRLHHAIRAGSGAEPALIGRWARAR